MIKRERIDEANMIRAIACLAVILVHITADAIATLNPGSPHSFIFTIINRSAKFTTPVFLFLSGLTLYYSYSQREFKYNTFLKKRFKSTIVPYLIWSMIYFLFFYSQGIYVFSIEFIMKNILLANMSYHLYFVLTITQFYLLFGVFLYAYKKYNSHILLGITLIANLLFLKYGLMPYSDRFFMKYIFFFSLGCYVAKNLYQIKKNVIKFKYPIIIGYIVTTLYESYTFYKSYVLQESIDSFVVLLSWAVFSAVSIFLLVYVGNEMIAKELKINNFFKTISKSSYYIYLSHPLVLYISNKFLLKNGINSITGRTILNGIIVYSVTLTLCIMYTKLKLNIKNRKKVQGRVKSA